MENLGSLDLSGNKYSQYGEEVIIQEIFKEIGMESWFYVDIGAGLGISNTRLLEDQGWKGLAFDMTGGPGTIKEFITPLNIVTLLNRHSCCPNNFDFLSIDIDSCDYDVLKNVLMYFRPRLICAEYNATLDPNIPVKLKYEHGYTWDQTNKYGFSWSAGVKLFETNGYTVVHNHKDTNMFAVRKDLVTWKVPAITPKQNIYHPINPNAIWEQV